MPVDSDSVTSQKREVSMLRIASMFNDSVTLSHNDPPVLFLLLFYLKILINLCPISFRNKDKVARSVKIIAPDSKLFSVVPSKKVKQTAGATAKTAADVDVMSSRVAPGMEVSYVVRFSPEAKIDYSYDLTVVTEREKFIVPIRAVGCRAQLDFPETLNFGAVPVKHTSEKPIMVRNIGEKTTKWHV